jgi:hypothetical protein
MKKIILFVLALISLVSCNSLVRQINGEKKAKKETIESLKNYVETGKFDINIEDCLFIKDQKSIELLATYNRYYISHNYSSTPRHIFIFLFNKEHLLVDEDTLGGCVMHRPRTSENFYTALLNKNAIIKGDFSLDNLSNSFVDFNGKPVNNLFEKNKPVLLIVWAKFRGDKLNREFLDETQKTLINKSPDLQVLYLNIDQVFYECSNPKMFAR